MENKTEGEEEWFRGCKIGLIPGKQTRILNEKLNTLEAENENLKNVVKIAWAAINEALALKEKDMLFDGDEDAKECRKADKRKIKSLKIDANMLGER